ncbi:alpha/beta fold hydrolase [Stappia indica]|uniref:Alpha/beta hydrolase family protein n=1 Tax=Stappia indica TaxID=538381 RepID=A0A857C754_9HYPH|nr:alpha/beta fold hydrolase [Stappia indica]QGZ34695.1 hypothetical protein GH266_09300 [Stappia indica]
MTKGRAVALADFGSFHVEGRLAEITGEDCTTIRLTETITEFVHDPNGRYAIEGAYVQYMIPEAATGKPVLLIHGGGMNGAVWETTPDGRKGWMRLLLEAGHPVYVVDMVERGRAGFCALESVWTSRPIMRSIEDAWETFRIGHRQPDGLAAHPGQRFPADHFIKGAYAWSPRWPDTDAAAAAALEKAIRRIGPCHIIAHSSGSATAFQVLSGLATGEVLSLCLVEPAGLPQVPDFPDVPLLAVWGDFIGSSHLWQALRETSRTACAASGLHLEELLLSDVGLAGHSHLPMQDLGNEQVLGAILTRLVRPSETRRSLSRHQTAS